MKYHLDSMLPLQAFAPRSGRARGFAAGGMTLEGGGEGGYNNPYGDSAPLGFQWTPENQGNWNAPAPAPVDAGAVVTQMYEAILGRAPDPGGYEAFVNAVNSGADVGQLAQSMASSQEAQNNAASGQGPSQAQVQNTVQQATSAPETFVQQAAVSQVNKDYVTALYQGILGRAPDAQGLQDNLDALASGRITAQQLADSFAKSPEAGSNKIPATQEKQMAEAMALSYGKPAAQITTDQSGYPSNWENVSPAQLVKMGITNPVILKAAAEGKLDNPTFGALGLDARAVQNAANSGTTLSPEFIKAQEKTTSSFTPNGKVTGTKMANANQAVYYFSDGSTALVNRDGTIDHITPPVSNYRQQEGSIARADNPGYVMFNGQMVRVETPPLTYDPQAGKVVQNSKGIPTTYDPGPQGSQGPLGFVSNNLANLDKGVSSAVPGGWTTIGLVAASALSAGTLAPMASTVGGAILGSATATGATTLGTAIIGASTSALMAAATGGDIGKAALMGAIGGAIGANSGDIAAKLVGGAENIAAIAAATGQTTSQVSNLITNAVSTGISAAAAGKGDIASMIGATLASTAVGNYTGNVMRSLDSSLINSVANSVSTIARVGTTAALNGKDPQQAITNSMGQIIGNMVSQNLIRPGIESVKTAIKNDNTTAPVTTQTEAQKNAELVDQGFKQMVAEFSKSTGTEISPEELDKYLASQQPKYQTELPDYFSTAQNVTVTQAPQEYTDSGMGSTPLVPKPSTPALTPEEIAQQDAEFAAADKAAADKLAADAAIEPNQSQLDKLWQDYMSGVKAAPNTVDTTFSLGNFNAANAAPGAGGTAGPGTGTTGTDGTGAAVGTGTGQGTGTTAGTGTGAGGTGAGGAGAGGTGTGTGGGGTGTGGTTVVQKPGTIKKVTAPGAQITGTIPSVFGTGDIAHLTPGLVKGSEFKFASEPTFSEQVNTVPQTQPYDYSEQILNAATGGSTNTANTIEDLQAGLVKGTPFRLASQPKFAMSLNKIDAPVHTDYSEQILNAAQGGLINGYASGGLPEYPDEIPTLTGRTWRGHPLGMLARFYGARFPGFQQKEYAEGGEVQEHNPEFFSEGGLGSMENRYVKGEGDGTSDSVPAMLANGEFVIPADVVSKLGNGSNDAGAGVLDKFLVSIREHAQDHDPKKLPPNSKGPLAYLLDAKRKVG